MSKTHRHRLLGISTLNAGIMLVITFVWLGLPYTFGDEAFFIKWTALTKKSLLGIDPKPDPEEVLFVDISGSKTIIEQPNEFGQPSPYFRQVITDRTHLAEFLSLMAPYKEGIELIVLDVLFDQPTEADSSLQVSVDKLGDKLLGITQAPTPDTQPLVIDFSQSAMASYRTTQGAFMKYPLLYEDSLVTTPVRMYELLHQEQLDYSGTFFRFERGISLRNPIVDYKVRESDFQMGTDLVESNFTLWSMGTLLESRAFMPDEAMAEYFKDRIVIVGDFVNDVHNTPFGNTAGPLLIYNAYLSLADGNNIVSVWWVLFLFTGYWLISWRAFNDIEMKLPADLAKKMNTRFGRIFLNTIDDAFLLILMTVLSYFLFRIHITILILLVYIKVAEFCWDKRTLLKKAAT
ncbi:MAG: CHASE2 domain-containing protein [Bacteroidota bacterium]